MTSIVPEPLERTDGAEAPLLDVRDLRTYFKTDDGIVRAVDGVSFSVRPGQTLGVVGESGSGKSVTMMSILSLNPKPGRMRPAGGSPPGPQMDAFLHGTKKHTSVSTGQALFRGENLLEASQRRLRALRGNEISMIFQDPMTSLNPVLSIGNQLVEAIMLHRDVTSAAGARARDRGAAGGRHPAAGAPDRRLSAPVLGGDAPAGDDRDGAINDPALLIADEPTTALDVTTQAQILGLIQQLQADHGTAVVLITHDLGVVAETADDIVVMYAARIAEQAPVYSLFEQPQHPYTWGLLGSLPRLDVELERLTQIRGQPPSLLRTPPGCRFRPRCAYAFDRCRPSCPRRRLPRSTPIISTRASSRRSGSVSGVGTRRSRARPRRGGSRDRRPARGRERHEALPDHAGDRLQEGGGVGQGARRRLAGGASRRDARDRRRVRMREVDPGPRDHAPPRGDERDWSASTGPTSRSSRSRTCGGSGES